MSALAQLLALSGSIVVAFVWLNVPPLHQFSLPAFGGCILLYFLLKKINDAKIWQLLPTTAVDEMVLVTFAFLILIGATDGASSVFFFLSYVYLFFVSMTIDIWPATVLTLETVLFLYALTPDLSWLNFSHLLSLPVVMSFFLFGRFQYQRAKENQNIIEIEHHQLNNYQIYVANQQQQLHHLHQQANITSDYLLIFLENYLQPKITQLQNLINFPANINPIKGQLALINLKITALIAQLKQQSSPPAA